MTLILHGLRRSTCVQRVLVCAHQYSVPIRLAEVTTYADAQQPDWLERNPFGRMPVLEDDDDGFILYESRAIARYVVGLAGGLPQDLKKLALLEQAISVETVDFDEPAHAIIDEKLIRHDPEYTGKDHSPTDEAKVASSTASLASKLKVYETILSKQRHIAGDELTLADLFHLPHGEIVADLGAAPALVDGSLPNVTRWWAELVALPAWKRAKGGEAGA